MEARTNEAMKSLYGYAYALPQGGAKNRLINLLDKASRSLRKVSARKPVSEAEQIGKRYIANEAIFRDMIAGRWVSLEDSAFYGVSEMHTQICHIRQKIEKRNLPYILISRPHITRGGMRCKAYTIIHKEEEA